MPIAVDVQHPSGPFRLTFDQEPTSEQVDEAVQSLAPEDIAALRRQVSPTAQAGLGGIATAARMAAPTVAMVGLPTALAIAAPTALAGVGAGLAVRAGLGALGGFAGLTGAKGLIGAGPRTKTEAVMEALGPLLGELPISYFKPSKAQEALTGLWRTVARKAGRPLPPITDAVSAGEAAAQFSRDVGGLLRTRIGKMRSRLGKERDRYFTRLNKIADRHKIAGELSPRSLGLIDEILGPLGEESAAARQVIETGILDSSGRMISRGALQAEAQQLDEMTALLQRLRETAAVGGAVPLSDLTRLRLLAFDEVPQFTHALGAPAKTGPNPYIALRASVGDDVARMAAGTPAERAALEANNFYTNEFLPGKKALRLVNNASPEAVIDTLIGSKDYGNVTRFLGMLDEPTQNAVRSAWFQNRIEGARDASGLVSGEALFGQWKGLDSTIKRALGGKDWRQVGAFMETLEVQARRAKYLGQVRIPQALTLSLGVGSVAAALGGRDGESSMLTAVAWLTGTAAGAGVLAQIVASPATRRLAQEGLTKRGQVGWRLFGQAIDRSVLELTATQETSGVTRGQGQQP